MVVVLSPFSRNNIYISNVMGCLFANTEGRDNLRFLFVVDDEDNNIEDVLGSPRDETMECMEVRGESKIHNKY